MGVVFVYLIRMAVEELAVGKMEGDLYEAAVVADIDSVTEAHLKPYAEELCAWLGKKGFQVKGGNGHG